MRVFVTGPTGSGKTTLARSLSRHTGLPIHSLDDIHWVPHPGADRRREPAERSAILDRVVQAEAWIIEGVQFKWTDGALERADLFVVLDVPRWRSVARILRRFAGRRLASGPNPRGTLTAVREELCWSADYYASERRMLFDKLAGYSGRILIVRSRRDLRTLDAVIAPVADGSVPPGCAI
ncbi:MULTISPECIES: hypothetical protein [Methylobacterium]|uniref:hypothetical protein n=1 Tax=Methylobacterium TaxID=407 RepID=UPI0013E9AC3E|nr:hypothetical protein [Methylobacterium sp. DB0501]NGM35219.1 hypothetical protein [Methylobacterium sp. DB0501]